MTEEIKWVGIDIAREGDDNCVFTLCRQDMPSFKRTVLVELEKYQDAGDKRR